MVWDRNGRTWVCLFLSCAMFTIGIAQASPDDSCQQAQDLLINIERMSPFPHPAQAFWLRRAQYVFDQLKQKRSFTDIQPELGQLPTPELRPLLIWAVIHLPVDDPKLITFRRDHLRMLRQAILKVITYGPLTYRVGMRLIWHLLIELETNFTSERTALKNFLKKENALLYILSAFQTPDDILNIDTFSSFSSGAVSTLDLITRSREPRIHLLANAQHPLAAFLPTVDSFPLSIANTQRMFPVYPILIQAQTPSGSIPRSPMQVASQHIAQGWFLAKNDLEPWSPPPNKSWDLETFTYGLKHIFARIIWERFRQEKIELLPSKEREVFEAIYAELVINRGWAPSPQFFWARLEASQGERGLLETLAIIIPDPLRQRYGDAAIHQALSRFIEIITALKTHYATLLNFLSR